MKKAVTAISLPLAGVLGWGGVTAAHAQNWNYTLTPSLATGSYHSSSLRERFSEAALFFDAQYHDVGGLAVGLSKTRVLMKSGATPTDQEGLVLSGRRHWYGDGQAGRYTLRVDAHNIRNNDPTGNTDKVTALAGQMAWLSYNKNWYLDVGVAQSRYQNDLTVNQITPTLGIGFNGGADWLQLRSYQISGMNTARAAGKSSTASYEAQWTHYFTSPSPWVPVSTFVSAMGGERLYAVDMDAQSVSNLSDLQTGSAQLGASWKTTKQSQLMLLLGRTHYRNATIDNDYFANVLYANVQINY